MVTRQPENPALYDKGIKIQFDDPDVCQLSISTVFDMFGWKQRFVQLAPEAVWKLQQPTTGDFLNAASATSLFSHEKNSCLYRSPCIALLRMHANSCSICVLSAYACHARPSGCARAIPLFDFNLSEETFPLNWHSSKVALDTALFFTMRRGTSLCQADH